MKDLKIFCFGFGQVAKYFVKRLSNENLKIELTFDEKIISFFVSYIYKFFSP